MSSRSLLVALLGLAVRVMADDSSMPSSSMSAGAPAPSSTSAGAPASTSGAPAQAQDNHGNEPDITVFPSSQYFLCGLIGLAFVIFLYRAVVGLMKHFRRLVSLTHEQQNFFREVHAGAAWFKRNILYAPMFRKRHTKEMTLARRWGVGILPTRLQMISLVVIIAFNIFFCLYSVDFSASRHTWLNLIRNRTGTAATVNCIPLVIFASRNNPLIFALDISFDSFNLLHRWFGRIAAIEAAAHFIVVVASLPHGMADFNSTLTMPQPNWLFRSGTVAVFAFILIPIQASSVLRHAFYETFLLIHQLLVTTAFVGVWYHLRNLKEHIYIEAVVALWAVERAIRFITLIYRNVASTRTTATVEVLPGEAMRVTLHMPRPWRMHPGQHLFLNVPSIGLWTSHPFSVAWSSESPEAAFMGSKQRNIEYDAEKAFPSPVVISTSETSSTGEASGIMPATSNKHTLSAIIRVRNGFTKSLYRKASNAPKGKINVAAFAEGPYGQQHTMASYGTVVLFAGGVGITHTLPYIRTLIAGCINHTVATRRITLVWVIQSPEHLEWIRPWMTSILAMEGRRDVLRIEIYVSRPRSQEAIQSPSETVRMFAGRPRTDEIVAREAQSAVGAMGVAVCGPGALGDDVRQAVRNVCEQGTVDLMEECFSW